MPKFKAIRKTEEFSVAFPVSRFIWRLSTAEELFKLDTLLEGGLYMARLDTFDDPREGALGRKTKSLLDKDPPYAKKYIIAEYQKAIRQSFASCWHGSNKDPSEHAWCEFGGNHSGFAIRTTPERLRAAVQTVLDCGAGYIGDVRYKNHDQEPHELKNILEAHFVVKDDYKDEEEVRFLLHTFGPNGQKLIERRGPKGPLARWRLRKTTPRTHECVGGHRRGMAILLGIDARKLIEEVLVGRCASLAFFEDIRGRAAMAGIRCRQEKALT